MPEPATIPRSDVTARMLDVLREAFEGPGDHGAYFTDRSPSAGLLHTLGPVAAHEASRIVGGTSIAAHARHLLFGLRDTTSFLEGDRSARDWRETWHTDPVTAVEWDDLREGLRSAYTGLRNAIETHGDDSADAIGEIAGVIAHIAYHLGAIRSKVVCGREEHQTANKP